MKRYQVSKLFGVTAFLVGVALYVLAFWAVDALRYAGREDLESALSTGLHEKQYVYTEIDHIVMHRIRNEAGDTYTANKSVFLMPSECKLFTAVLKSGGMVGLLVSESSLAKQLESFADGRGEKIRVVGQVEKGSLVDTEAYYADVEGFERSLLAEDLYVIQMPEKGIKAKIGAKGKAGLGILALALISFFTIGGWHRVDEPPFEDTREYRDYLYRFSYGLEKELARKKEYMSRLIREQQGIYRWCLLGGGLVLAANALLLWSLKWMVYSSAGFYGFLISVAGMILGVKFFWHGFINSDRPIAKKLSDTFLLNTLSVRREQTSKLIGLLTRKINEGQQEPDQSTGWEV